MRWIIVGMLTSLGLSAVRGAEPTNEVLSNWHHWRGPLANGTAPNGDPPIKWDEKTNIRWKTPIPGRGSATPIIWGDNVFVVTSIKLDKKIDPSQKPKVDPKFDKKTDAPLNYYQFVVMCLDRKSGKVRWEKTATEQVPHEGHHVTHSYAAGSPTTDGKFLYVSFGSFGIFCYDFDGQQQWKAEFGKLNTRLGWGEAVTPVIHGDSLLLNWDQEADSALICLDVKNGKEKWRAKRPTEKTSWNTPLVVTGGGKTQVIVNGTDRVRSYDLADGKVIWECGGMTVNAIPSPVAAEQVAYIMSGYRGAAAMAVPLDAKGDLTEKGNVLWRFSKGTPYVPSPLLLGNRLYFTETNINTMTILDTKSGKALIERERLPTVKSFYGSPVAANQRIYLVDREGTALVLRAGDHLEVLATNRLPEGFDASPAIVGKELFLRGDKHLYCIAEK